MQLLLFSVCCVVLYVIIYFVFVVAFYCEYRKVDEIQSSSASIPPIIFLQTSAQEAKGRFVLDWYLDAHSNSTVTIFLLLHACMSCRNILTAYTRYSFFSPVPLPSSHSQQLQPISAIGKSLRGKGIRYNTQKQIRETLLILAFLEGQGRPTSRGKSE